MQSASAQTMAYSATSASRYPASVFAPMVRQANVPQQAYAYAPAQQPYESLVPEPPESAAAVPAHLLRQTVNYPTREAPGTIVVDTPNTYLYYVLGGGKAVRYGIGVGREGFTWSGRRAIERKAEWPDWVPPPEMIQRQPYLPRFMAGGEGNPLGARALYIGGTIYRIHGTNAPSSIGQNVSSGCIRMLNEDVIDLYSRVNIGTKVVVLPAGPRSAPVIAGRERDLPQATLTGSRLSGVY
ncbi:MAG TPA: L,D-transpeptidase [Xanthobacteraceae bacterium]|nr:L,D-transpeptidase [Xanthobacteraceae bacterium]